MSRRMNTSSDDISFCMVDSSSESWESSLGSDQLDTVIASTYPQNGSSGLLDNKIECHFDKGHPDARSSCSREIGRPDLLDRIILIGSDEEGEILEPYEEMPPLEELHNHRKPGGHQSVSEMTKQLTSENLILQAQCNQLKSELCDVRKDHDATVADLNSKLTKMLTTKNTQADQIVWKSSDDTCVCGTSDYPRLEILQCPPMIDGVHKWSIRVEEDHFSALDLGVVSAAQELKYEKSLIGNQIGGWGYFGQGMAHNNGIQYKRKLPSFQKGSTITFLLDLTEEGSLSVTIDNGRPMFRLFSDMLQIGQQGFIPAVALEKPAKVRFLGFEKVSAEDAVGKMNAVLRIVSSLERNIANLLPKTLINDEKDPSDDSELR